MNQQEQKTTDLEKWVDTHAKNWDVWTLYFNKQLIPTVKEMQTDIADLKKQLTEITKSTTKQDLPETIKPKEEK